MPTSSYEYYVQYVKTHPPLPASEEAPLPSLKRLDSSAPRRSIQTNPNKGGAFTLWSGRFCVFLLDEGVFTPDLARVLLQRGSPGRLLRILLVFVENESQGGLFTPGGAFTAVALLR